MISISLIFSYSFCYNRRVASVLSNETRGLVHVALYLSGSPKGKHFHGYSKGTVPYEGTCKNRITVWYKVVLACVLEGENG